MLNEIRAVLKNSSVALLAMVCEVYASGTITYLDNASQVMAAANVTLELRSPGTTTVLSSIETSKDGSYVLSPVAATSYDVVVVAKNSRFEFGTDFDNRVAPVTVYNMVESYQGQMLGTDIGDITISANAWAFHTLQILEKGYDKMASFGKYPERMTRVLYPKNSTSFIKGDRAIRLSSDQLWKEDVLLHEWMHLIAYTNSQTDSSGGLHYLNGHYDLRMAWNEGMANYASAYFRNDTTVLGLNIETMSTGIYQRSTNEMGVANILWMAGKTYGHEKVFSIIWEFKDLLSEFDENSNLDFFHDRWNVHYPNDSLQSFYDARFMSYKADLASGNIETDPYVIADVDSSTLSGLTWYPKGDEDYFKVDVLEGYDYTFRAHTMTNGGLPKLELMRSGVVISSKEIDDMSVASVSSTILHKADRSESLILRTSRFNSSTSYGGLGIDRNHYPMTTGYYGGYDLSFSSNHSKAVTSTSTLNDTTTPSAAQQEVNTTAQANSGTQSSQEVVVAPVSSGDSAISQAAPSSPGGGGGGGCLLQ
jgi:hypothetical protein